MLEKVRQFTGKYDFPCHLVALWDFGVRCICVFLWSLVARWMLWIQGAVAGRGLRVDGRVIIRVARRGHLRLGEGVRINARPLSNLVGLEGPCILHCINDGMIEIGAGSGLSSTVVSARTRVCIGQRVNLGGNVRIYDHDFHSLDPIDRRARATDQAGCRSRMVEIADDVLIGANAIILKGVRLGAGCVVGAGAVVGSGDYPAGSVVAGNPARILRTLDAASLSNKFSSGGQPPEGGSAPLS